jgi:hypothetical protein
MNLVDPHLMCPQILREIGSLDYHRAVALITGPDYEWFKYLEGEIQQHFIGPDCYWRASDLPHGVTSPFGNAWWIPFPPTLVRLFLVARTRAHCD